MSCLYCKIFFSEPPYNIHILGHFFHLYITVKFKNFFNNESSHSYQQTGSDSFKPNNLNLSEKFENNLTDNCPTSLDQQSAKKTKSKKLVGGRKTSIPKKLNIAEPGKQNLDNQENDNVDNMRYSILGKSFTKRNS